jgi:hypothetical protein
MEKVEKKSYVLLFTKLGTLSTILPFIGFAEVWKRLMFLLSKKTKAKYIEFEDIMVNLKEMTFPDWDRILAYLESNDDSMLNYFKCRVLSLNVHDQRFGKIYKFLQNYSMQNLSKIQFRISRDDSWDLYPALQLLEKLKCPTLEKLYISSWNRMKELSKTKKWFKHIFLNPNLKPRTLHLYSVKLDEDLFKSIMTHFKDSEVIFIEDCMFETFGKIKLNDFVDYTIKEFKFRENNLGSELMRNELRRAGVTAKFIT